MQRRYHVILNTSAGTALNQGITSDSLQEAFAAQGLEATVDWRCEDSLSDRIDRAKTSGADVIVAAGGDGTATAIAESVVGTSHAMAILPLGTANLLARDLHLPLDVKQAVADLGAMVEKKIDVGEVNGRVFLHKVVVGVVPDIAAAREQIRGRKDFGATLGFFGYFVRRLARARRIAVEITPRDGGPRIERVQSIAIANNDYDAGLGRIFTRERLDGGSLSLYVIRHLSLGDVVRLTTEMILGTWREDEAIEIENVSAVTLRMKKRRVKAMMDGEVVSLDLPLRFRIRPGALTVLAPAPAADALASEPKDQPEFAVGI
jgi:diacylglycerol kinase family enzyme